MSVSQAQFHANVETKRAANFLFLGTVLMFSGFVFAFISGSLKAALEDKNLQYPSGRGYFPPSVSEMVHDTEDPAGRAFFAFEVTGAIFLFTSYYPWRLKNVYFGDDEHICGVSWPMLRQVLPNLAMWIVAMIPTVPIYKADIRAYMSIAIHGMFAVFGMFVGYPIIEGKALGWACLKSPKTAVEYFRTHPREQWWRKFFINVAMFFLVIFISLQIVLGLPNVDQLFDKVDVFEKDPKTDKMVLVDTADGAFLVVKVMSYLTEVMVGCFILANHMVIWYCSSERFIDLSENVPEYEKTSPDDVKEDSNEV